MNQSRAQTRAPRKQSRIHQSVNGRSIDGRSKRAETLESNRGKVRGERRRREARDRKRRRREEERERREDREKEEREGVDYRLSPAGLRLGFTEANLIRAYVAGIMACLTEFSADLEYGYFIFLNSG